MDKTRRYWRYVRRRAYGEARDKVRKHLGFAMSFAAVSAFAVLAVLIFGSKEGWLDDTIGVVAWLGAMLLVFGWLFLQRRRSIPPALHDSTTRAMRDAQATVTKLRGELERLEATRAAPPDLAERISFQEFLQVAVGEFGWNFGVGSFEVMDIADGVGQGAADGILIIEGKLNCRDTPEQYRHRIRLVPIPKAQWATYQVHVPGTPLNGDNFDIAAYIVGGKNSDTYYDLHIADRAAAAAWLKKFTANWKGKAKAAFDANEERKRLWEEAEEAAAKEAQNREPETGS